MHRAWWLAVGVLLLGGAGATGQDKLDKYLTKDGKLTRVLVVRNPFFSSVDQDGRFSIKLPPGRRRLVLWRPREREISKDIEVLPESRTEIDWVLSPRRP